MAFPTTPILDDFNRGDQNPVAGIWTGPLFTAENQLKVVSSQLVPASTDGNSYINGTTYGPNVEAYCTLVSSFGTSYRVIFYFRSTTGTVSGYRADFRNQAGDHRVNLDRMDSNAVTTLGGSGLDPADTFAAGDKFGVSMVADTIEAWRCPSGGSWTSLGTRTDSTYTGAGYLGLSLVTTGVIIDDFGGGNIGGGHGKIMSFLSGVGW